MPVLLNRIRKPGNESWCVSNEFVIIMALPLLFQGDVCFNSEKTIKKGRCSDSCLATGEDFRVPNRQSSFIHYVKWKIIVEPAILAGHFMETNLAKQPSLTGVLVAPWFKPWLGHPTGSMKVVGFIPTWNSEFFSVAPAPVAKQLSLHHFTQGFVQRHFVVSFFFVLSQEDSK